MVHNKVFAQMFYLLLLFSVTIENPLVANKDPEKGDRFCPTTPRYLMHLLFVLHCVISDVTLSNV